MAYAIICDAHKGGKLGIEILALVDRAKTKSLWWTSDDTSLILNYLSLDAANFACNRLRLNNPRVVDFIQARDEIRSQADHITELMIQVDDEMGWDAHKNY